MKALPCKVCKKPALGPNGKPLLWAWADHTLKYKCMKCRHGMTLSLDEFHALPEVVPETVA